MRRTNLKPWRQVIEPHEDIRKGHFDESVYAASLGLVSAGEGALDYRDSRTFFKKTFMTSGLKQLLCDTLKILSGKDNGKRVIELQTPFGGGKTHALVSLYHLFANTNQISDLDIVKEILSEAKVKEIPEVRLAVVDGSRPNPLEVGNLPDNTPIRTLWGSLAYQLAGEKGFGIVAENDKKRVSPGEAALGNLLNTAGPCIILLDEILEYVEKAAGITVGRSNLGSQTISFVRDLAVQVANCPTAVLVATLVASQQATGPEAVRAFNLLQEEFHRVGGTLQIVHGEEIYGVLRTRLFDNIHESKAIQNTAKVYGDYYYENKSELPGEIFKPSANYVDKIIASYPFHPELVSILHDRWGSLAKFQRTRGVLRFFALTVGRLWENKNSGYLIQPSDIDFDDERLRAWTVEMTVPGYHAVFASDIAGKSAKAHLIDEELPNELRKFELAKGLARAIILYSISGGKEVRVGIPRLRLSVSVPELKISDIAEPLYRLGRRCWYLYSENNQFWFSTEENLNKLIVDKEDEIDNEDITELLRTRLADSLKDRPKDIEIRIWPKEPRDVSDISKLQLVYLDLRSASSLSDMSTAKNRAREILDKAVTNRVHKNMVIFCVPDGMEVQGLDTQARRYLALKAIDDDTHIKLNPENQRRLKLMIDDSYKGIMEKIVASYRYFLVPDTKGEFIIEDLGKDAFVASTKHAHKALEYLEQKDLVHSKLSLTVVFMEHPELWQKEQKTLSAKQLWDHLTSICGLQRPLSLEVFKSSIIDGVASGQFGYGVGDGEQFSFPRILYTEQIPSTQVDIQADCFLISKEASIEVKEEKRPIDETDEEDIDTGKIGEGKTPSYVTGKDLPDKNVYKKFSVEFDVSDTDWLDIRSYVFDELVKANAKFKARIVLDVESDEGLDQGLVDNGIGETLEQSASNVKWKKKE
jgi:hypothetical protein